MEKEIVVALSGNPNSGKTTIFNALTGSRQHVGNYPGVTVEKKEGFCEFQGKKIKFVDLPGTYSLSAFSIEEVVARDFILEERPDVVIDIVDSSNLERNLYLAVQLMELGIPLVLAFNMSDVAKARGHEIDHEKLSTLLNIPIVPTVGRSSGGLDRLLEAAVSLASKGGTAYPSLDYGKEVETEVSVLTKFLEKENPLSRVYPLNWLAIKLFEKDKDIIGKIKNPQVLEQLEKSSRHITERLGEEPAQLIAEARYGFISGVCNETVQSGFETRHEISDSIDKVLTHRVFGLFIFLGLMYMVFHLTFTLGEAPMGWIETLFETAGEGVSRLWPDGSESILRSLMVDGIIGGVGGVLVFLPNILLLFLGIAILEDTGYMARAAFLMDKIMARMGLHGKSFIPLLIGFGCSIPAIMATRTLENEKDRLATMLVAPLMSCGARLPIYALIIPAFFPQALNAPVLWTIYIIGVVLAMFMAKVLKSTILKGEETLFIMELPPYRLPTMKGLFLHMWERSWLYLKKAGTIILGISIILWAASTFPEKKFTESEFATMTGEQVQAETLAHTISGRIGHFLEPVISPMGFDWRIGTALVGALAAKEVFVAQMGIVYSVGEADEESEPLRERIAANYNPLQAFCIMLFCLISAPCIATIAVTRRESNSWKWAFLQFGGLTLLAFIVTTVVYQAGMLLQIGTS
jgi:ferrous iron transport protein B